MAWTLDSHVDTWVASTWGYDFPLGQTKTASKSCVWQCRSEVQLFSLSLIIIHGLPDQVWQCFIFLHHLLSEKQECSIFIMFSTIPENYKIPLCLQTPKVRTRTLYCWNACALDIIYPHAAGCPHSSNTGGNFSIYMSPNSHVKSFRTHFLKYVPLNPTSVKHISLNWLLRNYAT